MQLRPPPVLPAVPDRHGDGLALPDQHDEVLTPRHAGVEQVARQHGVVLGGLSQTFVVDVSSATPTEFADSRPEVPKILSAIAAKLESRSKDDLKGRHFEAGLIVGTVSFPPRDPLSDRDIEELLLERGPEVDHSTVNRWVLAYAPLIERRLRPVRKPHCGSVRVDETCVRIRGEWRHLYRAIDKHGEAVDFPLTARRDLDAAKRFFREALGEGPLLSPDRIGTDGAGTYPGAIAAARKEGRLARDAVHHVTKHLQQGIESDHFRLQKNMPRVGGFGSFNTARHPSRASRPCCGCARVSASRAPGRSTSKTGCSGCASDFQSLTKHETEVVQARSAT